MPQVAAPARLNLYCDRRLSHRRIPSASDIDDGSME